MASEVKANIMVRMQRYAKTFALYQSTLENFKHTVGENHRQTAQIKVKPATHYAREKDPETAR